MSITLLLHYKDKVKHLELDSRINQLLHEAHRSKELLPAIEQELRSLRQQVGQGRDKVLMEKLDASIREMSNLRRESGQADQEQYLAQGSFTSTGLSILDSQFIHEQLRALQKDINFEVAVAAPAAGLVYEGVIPQSRLQTMLGDLFRDAEAAVQKADGPRQILLTMGYSPEGYRISVSDTGAVFPAEVLNHIGRRQAVNGRQMYGYVDIIDTLARCRGSLRIAEFAPGSNWYTKTIVIVFDGHSELKVESYRPDVLDRIQDIQAIAQANRQTAGQT